MIELERIELVNHFEALGTLRVVHRRFVGQERVRPSCLALQELANRDECFLRHYDRRLAAKHQRIADRSREPLPEFINQRA